MLSFGWFPGVWNLYANISEHSVCSIFIGRGITQKKAYNIQNTAKVWNQDNIDFACSSVCITLPCHRIVMKFCVWRFYYLNGENEWLKSNVTGTLVAHGASHLSGMCSLCIVSMFGHCISVASSVLCESGQ
jgi:hypothetical protein